MTGKQWFARQKKEQIAQLTCQLDALLPSILRRHAFSKDNPDDFKSQQLSLHAKIGGKHTTYLNVTDNVISSPEEFAARWFKGLINHIKTVDAGKEASRAAYKFQQQLTSDPELLEYVTLFLKRTYWRNCDALAKKRPKKEEAALGLGKQMQATDFSSPLVLKMENGKTMSVKFDILNQTTGPSDMSWRQDLSFPIHRKE